MADWFLSWVQNHLIATGGGEDAGETIISNRRVVDGYWKATEAEMYECTSRIIRNGRTPKFANEHMDRLGSELRELRAATTTDAANVYARQWEDPSARVVCVCDGTGLIVVPHPRCIWHGNLVVHPGNGRFYTVAVICDECDIGRDIIRREDDRVSRAGETELRKRPKMLTWGRYTTAIHGHDGIALLRQYDRQEAERGRVFSGETYGQSFRTLVEKIVSPPRSREEKRDAAESEKRNQAYSNATTEGGIE